IINKAKTSLPESIQVCAKYCSSGRNLKDWELEAIMHYFKKTELTLGDINLTGDQLAQISQIGTLNAEQKKDLLQSIENSYTKGYSAHFLETMPREDRKYGAGGNVENGKYIYDNACLYCHLDGRVTYLKLNDDKLSAQMFMKHKTGYDDLSIYQIIRQGTYAMAGRNQYMPRYTKDKMSDQQIEDLVAYLKQLAEK
ncbi:MAG: c-type cytochrome, partial [Bacteroidota bacterium]